MSDGALQFDLVSPERILASENCDMVTAPGSEGEFGVMVNHAPLVAQLQAGVLRIYRRGQVDGRIFVAGGLAETDGGSRFTVLAEEAMRVEEINAAKTETELKNLREDLGLARDDSERRRVARRIAVTEAKLAAVKAT